MELVEFMEFIGISKIVIVRFITEHDEEGNNTATKQIS